MDIVFPSEQSIFNLALGLATIAGATETDENVLNSIRTDLLKLNHETIWPAAKHVASTYVRLLFQEHFTMRQILDMQELCFIYGQDKEGQPFCGLWCQYEDSWGMINPPDQENRQFDINARYYVIRSQPQVTH